MGHMILNNLKDLSPLYLIGHALKGKGQSGQSSQAPNSFISNPQQPVAPSSAFLGGEVGSGASPTSTRQVFGV